LLPEVRHGENENQYQCRAGSATAPPRGDWRRRRRRLFSTPCRVSVPARPGRHRLSGTSIRVDPARL